MAWRKAEVAGVSAEVVEVEVGSAEAAGGEVQFCPLCVTAC